MYILGIIIFTLMYIYNFISLGIAEDKTDLGETKDVFPENETQTLDIGNETLILPSTIIYSNMQKQMQLYLDFH